MLFQLFEMLIAWKHNLDIVLTVKGHLKKRSNDMIIAISEQAEIKKDFKWKLV